MLLVSTPLFINFTENNRDIPACLHGDLACLPLSVRFCCFSTFFTLLSPFSPFWPVYMGKWPVSVQTITDIYDEK